MFSFCSNLTFQEIWVNIVLCREMTKDGVDASPIKYFKHCLYTVNPVAHDLLVTPDVPSTTGAFLGTGPWSLVMGPHSFFLVRVVKWPCGMVFDGNWDIFYNCVVLISIVYV